MHHPFFATRFFLFMLICSPVIGACTSISIPAAAVKEAIDPDPQINAYFSRIDTQALIATKRAEQAMTLHGIEMVNQRKKSRMNSWARTLLGGRDKNKKTGMHPETPLPLMREKEVTDLASDIHELAVELNKARKFIATSLPVSAIGQRSYVLRSVRKLEKTVTTSRKYHNAAAEWIQRQETGLRIQLDEQLAVLDQEITGLSYEIETFADRLTPGSKSTGLATS